MLGLKIAGLWRDVAVPCQVAPSYIYIYIYIYIYVCMYVCIYIYIHIHIPQEPYRKNFSRDPATQSNMLDLEIEYCNKSREPRLPATSSRCLRTNVVWLKSQKIRKHNIAPFNNTVFSLESSAHRPSPPTRQDCRGMIHRRAALLSKQCPEPRSGPRIVSTSSIRLHRCPKP